VSDTAPPLDRPAPLREAPSRTRHAAGPGARPARPVLALTAGLLVALVVGLLRVTGVLEGFVALIPTFLLVLAVPSSRLGARRLLLAAGVAAGLLPALWWWDLPLGALGRVGLLLAALAGALTSAVLWQGTGHAGRRARLLLPTWRPVDLVVAGAAAFAAVACRGMLAVRSGPEALASLMPAWDNSAHANMVLMARRAGAVIPSLADPAAGDAWKFADYPAGYHAVVATMMELLGTATPGTVTEEILLMVRAQGFVLAAAAVVLVAGLCALPTAPRRPVAVALGAAGVVGTLLLGPGASAFTSGFPNFVLGCAMAGAAVLLALSVPRVLAPAPLAALGGLVVGVAHSWVLLLALAVPAVVLVVVPLRRAAWRASRRDVVLAAGTAALTLAGLVQAALTLRRLAPTEVLVIPGGIVVPDATILLAVSLAAVAVPLASSAHGSGRLPWLAAVPATGLVVGAGIGALQLRQSGELSYYFWKFALGVLLVSLVVLAAAVVARTPATPRPVAPEGRLGRWRTVAAVAIGCLALVEVHGLTGRSTGELRVDADQVARAADLLDAAETLPATGPTDAVYVRADDAVHPMNAQQWLLALTGTWTGATQDRAGTLLSAGTPAEVAALALAGGATLVVSPQDLVTLGLQDEPADRVVTWG